MCLMMSNRFFLVRFFCFCFFLTRQLVLTIRQQRRDKGVLPTAQIHQVAEEATRCYIIECGRANSPSRGLVSLFFFPA
uniref:Putative secreted protein n=1 Tax=Ixodes ricinus TaxID=34613 RepID=A0A6B0U6K0_IXORI